MDELAVERRRSVKIVQIVFSSLALFSLFAAIAVATHGLEFGLPEQSIRIVSGAFLIVGIADTVMAMFWDAIVRRMQVN